MEDLNELIEKLKVARERSASAKEQRTARLKEFEQTDEMNGLQAQLYEASTEAEWLETQVRETAKAMYEFDKNKHPHPKVEIRSFTVAVVNDVKRVREWCLQNLQAALKPDLKMVEQYAKDFGGVEGVDISTEVRAQIATKL